MPIYIPLWVPIAALVSVVVAIVAYNIGRMHGYQGGIDYVKAWPEYNGLRRQAEPKGQDGGEGE